MESLPPDFLSSLDSAVSSLIKQLFNQGKTTNEILKLTGSLLVDKVAGSYKDIAPDFTTPDAEMLARLTRDVWQFSAAKNYQQMRDLAIALKGDDGKLRNFADFKTAAESICAKYDQVWLRTEYNAAVASSQNAARWTDFMKDAENIPNIEYQTVGDTSVRDEHQALDGIIRPLKDPFWSTHYPPNGWGCRCEAIQSVGGKVTKNADVPNITIPPLFRTNLADTGLIYPKNHPYYDGIPRAEIRKAIAWLPPENTYLTVNIGKDKTIDIHPLHGEGELSKNIEACKTLLNHDPGAKLKLMPILNEVDIKNKLKYFPKSYIEKYGNKSADLLYNGQLYEFESPSGSLSSIRHAVSGGMAQSDKVIIHIPDNVDIEEAYQVINGHIMKHYSDVDKNLWLMNNKELRPYLKQKRH